MRRLLLLFTACLMFSATAEAQRSVPPRPTFSAYRQVDDFRLWTFLQKDSVIGTLTSRVDRAKEIHGVAGFALTEELTLDFTKVGGEHALNVIGEHYVAGDGSYLGSEIELSIGGQEGKLEVKRRGGELVGEIGRGRQEQKVSMGIPSRVLAIDNHMVDQFELYFAMRGLTEGDVIDDSIFVPRDMLMAPIRGQVIGWQWQELYKGVLDSVFVVRLEQPSPMELFINRGLLLRKINIPLQDMRIYRNVVRKESRPGPPPFSFGRMVTQIPQYVVFVLAGLVGMLLFSGGLLRQGTIWLAMLVGGIAVVVVALVQVPLQEYLFAQVYRPRMQGGMAIFWGLVAVLPAGVIQEGLKLLGILLLRRWRRFPIEASMAVGAAVGAGLGVIEAAYIQTVVGETDLFTWGVLQRVLFVLFHATSGALIGRAYRVGGKMLWLVLGATVAGNAVLRLLPMFLQGGRVDAGMLSIVSGMLVVGYMLWGVMWQRREI